nr:3-isopropylmalate dehydratase small subunit [Bacilli bacterium]
MDAFHKHVGIAAPLDRANIDTDAIIPKQFLKRIERTGFGQFLFFEWRFTPDQQPHTEFVLNTAPYDKATILVAGPNFGCGSSREHAPWALLDFGFKAIIAPSFADIFYNNCFKNGILPIVLADDIVASLTELAKTKPGTELTIDLEQQQVIVDDKTVYTFEVDAYRKMLLLEGLDDIGLSLQHEALITKYEQDAPFARPIA